MATKSTFKRIPWIFFDLDDTIWNFTANSAVALHKLYELKPILRKLFKSKEEFINIYHEHNALLWLMYSRGEVTTHQLKVERWRRTLATRQFEVLTAVCEELDASYLDILAECQEKFEGVEEMLAGLTSKALIAVLSNGFLKTQYKKTKYSGLERYITRTIVSEEIGVNKPNKRIFDYAISETGATAPYLYVGDNAKTDVLGAMRAGWHAIWVNLKGEKFPFSPEEMKAEGVNPDLLVGEVTSPAEAGQLIEKIISR